MIITWILGYFLIAIAIEVEAQRGAVHFASNVDNENEQIHDNFDENETSDVGGNEQQQYQEKSINSNTIPGVPGVDYPTYETIPRTSFTCHGKVESAYYADIETQCQVFHICQSGGHKNSFLCPTGSIFNQKYSVCDWWYSFDCDSINEITQNNDFDIQRTNEDGNSADNNYQNEIQHYQNIGEQDQYNNYNPNIYSDLSIASSGGNNPKDEDPGTKSTQHNKQRGNFKKTRNIDNNQTLRTTSTTIKPTKKSSPNRKTLATSSGEQQSLTTKSKINLQTSNLNKQFHGNNENKYSSSARPTSLPINNNSNDTNSTNTSIFNNNGGEYNTNNQQQQQYPNPYRNGLNGYLNGKLNGAKPISGFLASSSNAALSTLSGTNSAGVSGVGGGGGGGGDTFNNYNGDNNNNNNNNNNNAYVDTSNNYNYNSDEQKYSLVT